LLAVGFPGFLVAFHCFYILAKPLVDMPEHIKIQTWICTDSLVKCNSGLGVCVCMYIYMCVCMCVWIVKKY
jgi:hypothetical protein